MEGALAIRSYTVSEVRPLLNQIGTEKFLPQTVPVYSAAKYVHKLQEKYPQYSYKEAVLNPTNLENKARGWEAELVNEFRRNSKKEIYGIRETEKGASLYLSKPIRITNPKCLACHSTPEAAPQSLIDLYGSKNRFGWELNKVIGAQTEIFVFMGIVAMTYLVIGVIMNLLLNFFVVKPVKRISEYATEVSMGTLDKPELVIKGKDEISSLNMSFNRMQRSLKSAVSMISDKSDK